MTVHIYAAQYAYGGNLSWICLSVPASQQDAMFALSEVAAAKGGLVDFTVALPRQSRSRPSENLLYPTARVWWLAMGYDNVTGWRMAKLKFGVSHPYVPGWKPDRTGQFVEYDGAIHFVASEADYTQQEVSDMIDRLHQDCVDRGIEVTT